MANDIVLYGATGYVRGLLARRASELGTPVTLAGRNGDALSSMAGSLDTDYRVFSLDDPREMDEALAHTTAVLNCVGPFALSNSPLVESCLRTGTHCLDIAGEVPAFQTEAAYDEQAADTGVALLPGPDRASSPQTVSPRRSWTGSLLGRSCDSRSRPSGASPRGTVRTLLGDLNHGDLDSLLRIALLTNSRRATPSSLLAMIELTG
jgi:short subunit dehydrogenase-like uncharacterized protein